jgi:hypothetical protein
MKKSFLIAALAATISVGAFAQSDAGKRTGTVDELRACLNTQDEIEARQKSLSERSTQLARTAETLNAQSKDMTEEGQRVTEDPSATGSGRRARFDRKERAFKQEVEAHRTATEAFNTERTKIETDFTAFRQNCADKAYQQDDIAKVKKEREAAGKK